MYLKRKIYIGNEYRKEKERVKIIVPKRITGKEYSVFKSIKNERICYIEESIGYWRKVNSIHNWFVNNVQDGEDDCKEYYVSQEDLKKLIDTCKQVLEKVKIKTDGTVENIEDIKDLLPTVNGFFFGSTEYDEWYINDIKDTIKQLEPLLEEEGEFYYQSSW